MRYGGKTFERVEPATEAEAQNFIRRIVSLEAEGKKGTGFGSSRHSDCVKALAKARGWAIYRKVAEGGKGWEITDAGRAELARIEAL